MAVPRLSRNAEVGRGGPRGEGCIPSGVPRYLGRSDMFIKLGGQWVDLEALQEKIVALPCIKEAVLLQQEQQTQEYGVEERLGGIRFQHDGERASVHAFIIMK